MSAHQHRLDNLRRSFDKFKHDEQVKGSAGRGAGQRFAKLLGISPKLLSNLLHEQKPIGTALSRRFERALAWDQGQFDQSANAVKAESEPEAAFLRSAMAAWRVADAQERQRLAEMLVAPMAQAESSLLR